MSDKSLYMALPYDLSGARSKNRFRNEMLWGLERIFEIYRTGKDFTVVFDYVCDIEIHLDTGFEFYQVKTQNNSSAYTLNKILRQSNVGESTLGKLYLIKHHSNKTDPDANISLAIVSNTPFKDSDNNLHSTRGQTDFSVLSQSCREYIIDKLQIELSSRDDYDPTAIENLDFSIIKYIYTSMDLFHPYNSLQGQTVNFFNEVRGEEPKKPKALYCLLSDIVSEKACHELVSPDYDTLVSQKGFTRVELDMLLDRYTSKTDIAIQRAMQYIDAFDSFKNRLAYKKSLGKAKTDLIRSKPLQELEKNVTAYLYDNLDNMEDNVISIVDTLHTKFSVRFPIEYTEIDIKALMLLIMMKMEEDVYEQNDY